MEELPAYVKLQQADYAETPDPRVNRTPMEDGMVKQAATASRVLVARPFSALLTSKADYQSFKTWYYESINRADWFNFTDPVDGLQKTARFVGGKVEFKALRKDFERWMLSFSIETWNV